MEDPPRRADARILTGGRLGRLFFYGLIMAIGTLGLFFYAEGRGEVYAGTLAFTTFVFFQFFNLFNARNEYGTVFNRQFLRNRWLWISLLSVVLLQVLVVNWPPAQSVFRTTSLSLADWGLAAAVAASVLILDEAQKAVGRMLRR